MEHFLTTRHTLTTKFSYIGSGVVGYITTVYGPQPTQEKLKFLEEIQFLQTIITRQYWIIGEDFNIINSLEENKGGL